MSLPIEVIGFLTLLWLSVLLVLLGLIDVALDTVGDRAYRRLGMALLSQVLLGLFAIALFLTLSVTNHA